MRMSKSKLRSKLLARRNELATDFRNSASNNIVEEVLRQKALSTHDSVGLYWPTGSEVDVRPLIYSLFSNEKTVCFPKVRLEGKAVHMDFFAIQAVEQLKTGFQGILEPDGASDIALPSLLIVPGVGFGRNKTRLGYGGGTYDRYLAGRERPPFLIGVGFNETLETEVPAETHDWRMNLIITEDEVLS